MGTASAMAGDTWNFQAWFRDANPSGTSNFTNGVAVYEGASTGLIAGVMFYLPAVVLWIIKKGRQDNIFYGLHSAITRQDKDQPELRELTGLQLESAAQFDPTPGVVGRIADDEHGQQGQ